MVRAHVLGIIVRSLHKYLESIFRLRIREFFILPRSPKSEVCPLRVRAPLGSFKEGSLYGGVAGLLPEFGDAWMLSPGLSKGSEPSDSRLPSGSLMKEP